MESILPAEWDQLLEQAGIDKSKITVVSSCVSHELVSRRLVDKKREYENKAIRGAANFVASTSI